MCFPLLGCLVDVLPYICVVTVPVYGSFCGIDLILRVSILFYAYALITQSQYGPNFLRYVLPYLNLSLLVLTLIYLPINLVPYPLVWLYDKILWVTEPALMIAEIVLALNFVMHCSQRVIEKMEEDDSNVWKILTIGFSSLCYALTASASWDIYLEGTKGQMMLLFVVLILCLTMHNMMWMSQEDMTVENHYIVLVSTYSTVQWVCGTCLFDRVNSVHIQLLVKISVAYLEVVIALLQRLSRTVIICFVLTLVLTFASLVLISNTTTISIRKGFIISCQRLVERLKTCVRL